MSGWTAEQDRLRRDVTVLAARPRGRRHAPAAMEQAETYVSGELAAAGWQVHREPFDLRWRLGSTDERDSHAAARGLRLHHRVSGANLRAELPGHAGGATVVVGAHLDTVAGSPGADDNASGVAALLETARILGARKARPAVTLMVFDAEELGLIGARAAVRRTFRDRPVAGMINLECVGFFRSEPESQQLPFGADLVMRSAAATVRRASRRGDFTLVVHRRSSRRAAACWQEAAARLPHTALLLRDPRPDGPAGRALGLVVPPLAHLDRSDHSAFWDAGVPALMVTDTADFRNAHYHRPGDTPDTLDFSRMAGVATATAITAARWAAVACGRERARREATP